ncbi:MAG: ABC transporter substrate-binding protein [Leptospiraceae bacterium]|nr:ABC transporter substrate-binding protein [Leptospiraceae bacterium]MBP9165143.1 ABC transporter substrate-binding protein [Leptospiraceae bacterium]
MRKELLPALAMRINRLPQILILILLVSCTEVKTRKSKIRLGVPPRTNFMHVFIAEEKGLFKKNGLEVELFQTENLSELYSEKKLDVICTGLTESIVFSSEGHETKIIYRFSDSFTTDIIIAGSKIKDLGSLKKKKISFDGVNSSSHIFVQQLLGKNGIQDGEYFAVNLPVNQVLAKLESGEIDAGHTTGVSLSEISKREWNIIGRSSDDPNLLSDTLSVDAKFLETHSSELKKLIQSLDEANQFYSHNSKEAIAIVATKIKKTDSEIKEDLDGLRFLTLEENQGTLKAQTEDMSKLNPQRITQNEGPTIGLQEGPRMPGIVRPDERMDSNYKSKVAGLFTAGETIIRFLKERGQIYRNPDLKTIIDDSFVKSIEAK